MLADNTALMNHFTANKMRIEDTLEEYAERKDAGARVTRVLRNVLKVI